MKGDEVRTDRRDLGQDLHHPVVGGKGRLERRNSGPVRGEGVSERRRGRFDREFDHAGILKHFLSALQGSGGIILVIARCSCK